MNPEPIFPLDCPPLKMEETLRSQLLDKILQRRKTTRLTYSHRMEPEIRMDIEPFNLSVKYLEKWQITENFRLSATLIADNRRSVEPFYWLIEGEKIILRDYITNSYPAFSPYPLHEVEKIPISFSAKLGEIKLTAEDKENLQIMLNVFHPHHLVDLP